MGRGVAAVKMSQRNMHRTALLLMVGSGILLTAGNGTDAYPIVGYSQAVAASEDSTGILLEQSVQGLVPLLGYGDIRETRTQPPEDESTWHTLTTEELLGADGILPQLLRRGILFFQSKERTNHLLLSDKGGGGTGGEYFRNSRRRICSGRQTDAD